MEGGEFKSRCVENTFCFVLPLNAIKMDSRTYLEDQESIELLNLTEYFTAHPDKFKFFHHICKKKIKTIGRNKVKYNISNRLFDRFMSDHCRKHPVVFSFEKYLHLDPPVTKTINFDVASEFSLCVQSSKRKGIDSYKRVNKRDHKRSDNNLVELTINGFTLLTNTSQIRFYKWMMENKIFDYLVYNVETVQCVKTKKARHDTEQRKRQRSEGGHENRQHISRKKRESCLGQVIHLTKEQQLEQIISPPISLIENTPYVHCVCKQGEFALLFNPHSVNIKEVKLHNLYVFPPYYEDFVRFLLTRVPNALFFKYLYVFYYGMVNGILSLA